MKEEIIVSKSELINTFSNIDEKINMLHQRSSSDFMQLNNYLKDYHKKARIISENSFRIIGTISGEKDLNLINELEKIQSKLDEYGIRFNDEDIRKMQLLKQIVLKSNQLSVILRNLRQDFTTFKFLSTNFCLISNYADHTSEWNNKLEVWNKEILAIQKSMSFVSLYVEDFIESVNKSINHISLNSERSLTVFQNLSKETKLNIASIAKKSKESKTKFPLLKDKTAASAKSISDIITHLQYQDIIRQKIEHIQKSHQSIINDLIEDQNRKDSGCNPGDYSKISDIVDLQAAQLLLVSKEYQNALNVITGNFQGIANALSTISGISNDFSFRDNTSNDTLLKQIKDQLDKGIFLLDLNNFNEINKEYLSAGRKLDMINNQIKHFIQPVISELTKLGQPDEKEVSGNSSGSGVLSQIISLIHDIENKNNEIIHKTNEIKILSSEVLNADDYQTWSNQLEMDHIRLMVRISKVLDSLDKDNQELDDVLLQNRDLNMNILEKIESTVNRGDYYEYFEKIVEQIISQLTDINTRIRMGSKKEFLSSKADNLENIKTNYTMNSERIIHDNVVAGKGQADLSVKSQEEIEFF
jgi:hypothetical protein